MSQNNPPPPRLPPHSSLSVAAFVVALSGFVLGLVPFAGVIGTVGAILAWVDLSRRDPGGQPLRHGLANAAVVLGVLATLGVGVWVLIFYSLSRSVSPGSCPHVYAFDGEDYRLDADLVSGALYAGAERDDLDRLESLRPVGGEYRVRIADELQETDHVDSLSLLYVDHPAGVEVLPTQTGQLLALRDAAAPIRAVENGESHDTDVLPLLTALDGHLITGQVGGHDGGHDGDRRARWTLEFARPATNRAALIVRGHSTPFAEEALGRYLATMGQGLRPLLEWACPEASASSRRIIDEEIARLGLPLSVQLSSGGAWVNAESLQPVGPAILRSQALLVDLPPGGDRVSVRLEGTPRFWEIDQVELAPVTTAPLAPTELRPRAAVRSSGEDVTTALAERDGEHVVLHPGEHVDVRFEAPPLAPGFSRTVVASMRGYYAVDIGGHRGVNPLMLVAHRLGLVSLQRFAGELAGAAAAR